MATRKLAAVPEDEVNAVETEVETVKGEVLNEARTLDFHGTALTLPAKLPASLFFDMTENEITGQDTGSAAVHTVYKLVGKDQWRIAKAVADEKGLSSDDFSDFIGQVYSAYGMGPGEAEASVTGSESAGN